MKLQSLIVLEMIKKSIKRKIILKRTKSPQIGSGKILRRAIMELTISSPVRRSNNTDFDLIKPKKRGRSADDQKAHFDNAKHKIVFEKWNSLGPPFVKHRVRPGKALDFSLAGIVWACKRHDIRTIVTAMEACHTLFSSTGFKFQWSKRIRRLTCYEFFSGYDRDTRERLKWKLDVRSWFNESLKGSEYLKQKYDIISNVKHEALFSILKDGWEGYNRSVITKREKEDLISCSNKVHSFAVANKKVEFARDIASAIIDWLKDNKPEVTTAYLKTDAFWQKKVPKLLIEAGIINEWDKLKW